MTNAGIGIGNQDPKALLHVGPGDEQPTPSTTPTVFFEGDLEVTRNFTVLGEINATNIDEILTVSPLTTTETPSATYFGLDASEIDHNDLANVGTHTHADIDDQFNAKDQQGVRRTYARANASRNYDPDLLGF